MKVSVETAKSYWHMAPSDAVQHQRRNIENVRCIVLEGRLDTAGAQAAEAEFNAAVAAGPNVVIDLGRVPFIASVGIRLLVTATQTQAKLGGRMVLMNADEVTRKILKTTGIDQLVPVCSGFNEALAVFG